MKAKRLNGRRSNLLSHNTNGLPIHFGAISELYVFSSVHFNTGNNFIDFRDDSVAIIIDDLQEDVQGLIDNKIEHHIGKFGCVSSGEKRKSPYECLGRPRNQVCCWANVTAC